MKAVLVIEVDEEDIGREVNYISVKGGGLSYIIGAKRDGVRLRPLPEKHENKDKHDYEIGWNDCLEEILGE